MRSLIPSASRSRSVMMAVVLGTAITAGEGKTAPQHRTSAPAGAAPDAVRDITRYCQVCWRNARLPADRWDDCTQQVFARLLERVDPTKWDTLLKEEADERREFLRAIDTVKKRTQRTKKYMDLCTDVSDPRNRSDSHLREQREAIEFAAKTVLSDRQRQIVEMTVEGWAVPDIAVELSTTPERVSDEKYKAIKKLRTHLGVDS